MYCLTYQKIIEFKVTSFVNKLPVCSCLDIRVRKLLVHNKIRTRSKGQYTVVTVVRSDAACMQIQVLSNFVVQIRNICLSFHKGVIASDEKCLSTIEYFQTKWTNWQYMILLMTFNYVEYIYSTYSKGYLGIMMPKLKQSGTFIRT